MINENKVIFLLCTYVIPQGLIKINVNNTVFPIITLNIRVYYNSIIELHIYNYKMHLLQTFIGVKLKKLKTIEFCLIHNQDLNI